MVKFAALGCLTAAVVAGQAQPPYMFVRMVTPKGFVTLMPDRTTDALSSKRIALQICVRARSVSDPFEQPSIRALNQHPDTDKVRPPPNVTLSLQRVTEGNGRVDVPLRVYSSDGGKNLETYFVDAEIDMLEDKDVRLDKARQFVEWMKAELPESSRSRLLNSPNSDTIVDYFEQQYIKNPPGDYKLSARYSPSTPQNWSGTMITVPLRLHISDSGDFFDGLKSKFALH